MNIEYLRYFLDVVNTKSITKAARLNFISPQGMSRAMGEFEKEIDCKLLERYPNRLGFTEQCEQLVPAVTKVVSAYDELVGLVDHLHAANGAEGLSTGGLRLLCQPISSFCFFPDDIMDSLLRTGDIRCLEADNQAIFQELKGLYNDSTKQLAGGTIGLTCLFNSKHSSSRRSLMELQNLGYAYKPFLSSYDMAMVNAQSPLAQKDILEDDDIIGQTIVTSNTELHETVSLLFGEQAISMTSGNVNMRRRAVARGDSISFMPAISLLNWDGDPNIVLKQFRSRYEIELGFIGSETDMNNPSFLALIQTLVEWYRAHDDPCLFTLLWN